MWCKICNIIVHTTMKTFERKPDFINRSGGGALYFMSRDFYHIRNGFQENTCVDFSMQTSHDTGIKISFSTQMQTIN